MTVPVPATFLAFAARSESWRRWLDSLPRLLADLLGEWGLSVDGPPRHGECAIVIPTSTRNGEPAALKVGWPHEESEHEHLALRDWAGRGSVRLLRADPRRSALLLERADGATDLATVGDVEACGVIAGLHRLLAIRPGPQYRELSGYAGQWADELGGLTASPRVPRRYVEQAIAAARDFAVDPSTDGVLISSDLHYFNVLRSLRPGDGGGWLAIDPKPLSGEHAHVIAPLLWNRFEEAVATGDVRSALQRRFYTVLDVLDLDETRARDWVVVRLVVNIMWALADEREQGVDLTASITEQITAIKAILP